MNKASQSEGTGYTSGPPDSSKLTVKPKTPTYEPVKQNIEPVYGFMTFDRTTSEPPPRKSPQRPNSAVKSKQKDKDLVIKTKLNAEQELSIPKLNKVDSLSSPWQGKLNETSPTL